jgi:hypothetical protein
MAKCACQATLYDYHGKKGGILIVTDEPLWSDAQQRVDQLQLTEFARVGLSVQDFRFAFFWRHKIDEENCNEARHLDQLSVEFESAKHILLCGSKIVMKLFETPARDLYGLQKKHRLVKARMMIAPNPLYALKTELGEYQLALKKFKESL